MKIQGVNSYRCDVCGEYIEREKRYSLSTYYQVGNCEAAEYGKANLGVRHICKTCKPKFEEQFKKLFKFYDHVVNTRFKPKEDEV